eukprot:CAMPEP_0172725930 /NCGR_PEP_ID=MMETSP1074-20121228/89570_1 /TAXON_ID=2916 /ORGANISM="Ceratium fusus, Strain PA161109" /LENGTH=90 /DNA_ID=CAMNT_0013552813 /DNA_START=52 /DNA_END=321 /DNA_ORIENTATION=+
MSATYGRPSSSDGDEETGSEEVTPCCWDGTADSNDQTGVRSSRTPAQQVMVPAGAFYATYHGHNARRLEQLLDGLTSLHGEGAPAIFLAG